MVRFSGRGGGDDDGEGDGGDGVFGLVMVSLAAMVTEMAFGVVMMMMVLAVAVVVMIVTVSRMVMKMMVLTASGVVVVVTAVVNRAEGVITYGDEVGYGVGRGCDGGDGVGSRWLSFTVFLLRSKLIQNRKIIKKDCVRKFRHGAKDINKQSRQDWEDSKQCRQGEGKEHQEIQIRKHHQESHTSRGRQTLGNQISEENLKKYRHDRWEERKQNVTNTQK